MPAIRVQSLSKSYQVGGSRRERYVALRDVIAARVRRAFGSSATPSPPPTDFWALKDVEIEVAQGERLAVIGRNGAGKSTLLKLLARITEPTEGRIEIHGRLASLLEVGTGFHPELTGRENIYLNGAILGMRNQEIRAKFDDIVAFAEVERFLDLPVKRYSSGMYVRLAFAVAAHLDTEILVVDEVLAVGDIEFQRKCVGRMEDMTHDGRTVILVSHNMSVLKQLCTRALLLDHGRVLATGELNEVTTRYVSMALSAARTDLRTVRRRAGDGRGFVTDISFQSSLGPANSFAVFEEAEMSISFELAAEVDKVEFFILVHSADGEVKRSYFQKDSGRLTETSGAKGGRVSAQFRIELAPGMYTVSAGMFDKFRNFIDWVEHVAEFDVEPVFAEGHAFDYRQGATFGQAAWRSTPGAAP